MIFHMYHKCTVSHPCVFSHAVLVNCVLLLGVTTLSVEGWLPRRSERAKKVGEERGEGRGVPVNASCGRTVKCGSKR